MKASEYIKELNSNKNEIKKLEDRNKQISEALIKAMKKNDITSMIEPDTNVTVVLVTSNKINFDVDKLEEKLDADIFKEITDLHIELDKVELRNLFDKFPQLKKQIKPALIKSRILNEVKLNKMLEEEILSMQDLDGTYTKTTNTYIRLNK